MNLCFAEPLFTPPNPLLNAYMLRFKGGWFDSFQYYESALCAADFQGGGKCSQNLILEIIYILSSVDALA
jgi:hypothetical protein